MKIKYIVYFLLIAGAGTFITYRIIKNKAAGETSGKPASQTAMPVSAIVIAERNFANMLSVSGSIDAEEQVDIQGEVSGLVTDIFFTEGGYVKKGQVLLKINDAELQASLSEARIKKDLAAENERRAALLLKKEAISQEEYDIARSELKTAQVQSQLIEAQIFKTSIRAPFSGKIGLRTISPGSYITPTTIVARLVNASNVKVTFSVPEKYSGQIRTNTTIRFKVPGSDEVNEAVVYAIEPSIETNTRTLKIRALAKNSNNKLLPGSFASVEVPLNNMDKALLIPTEAVVPVQNGKKVFVSEKGKAKEVKVETSTRTDKEILIISGLKNGDTVLTSGVMTLKNGTPVKVNLSKN